MLNLKKSPQILALLGLIIVGGLLIYFVTTNREAFNDFTQKYSDTKKALKLDSFNKAIEGSKDSSKTVKVGNLSTTVDRSGKYPDDFPDTVPKYFSATVDSFTEVLDSDASSGIPRQTTVSLITADNPQLIIDFFSIGLRNNGWNIYSNNKSRNGSGWDIDARIQIPDTTNSHNVKIHVGDIVDGKVGFSVNYFDLVYSAK